MTVTLKPLPYSCSKNELVSFYIDQMPRDMIIKEINTIILNNPARKQIVRGRRKQPSVSRLFHKEFMEFVAIYGAPKGYAIPTTNSEKA